MSYLECDGGIAGCVPQLQVKGWWQGSNSRKYRSTSAVVTAGEKRATVLTLVADNRTDATIALDDKMDILPDHNKDSGNKDEAKEAMHAKQNVAASGANLYLCLSLEAMIMSDIDGTVTKSNVRGIFDTLITEQHEYARFFTRLVKSVEIVEEEDNSKEGSGR